MQLGVFLLLAVTALLTCCDVISASENVNLSLIKTTSSGLGRSLRTSETGGDRRIKDLEDEDRANEFHEGMAKWFATLTKKSVPKSEKSAAVPTVLTKSNSLKQLEADEAIVMERLQHSLTEKFKNSKLDPDDGVQENGAQEL